MKSSPRLKTLGSIPLWCHKHSSKMKCLKSCDAISNSVIIGNNSCSLAVRKASYMIPNTDDFLLSWTIRHGKPRNKTEGVLQLTPSECKSAFGLEEIPSSKAGEALAERFGGEVAEPGKFFRWSDFLNIPCPGTGCDGDPNISIELDDEIKEAVRELLEM